MNEITCYLNSHPEIHTIVLLIGDSYDYAYLKNFIKEAHIKKLILVGSLLGRDIDTLINLYERDKKDDKGISLGELKYIDYSSFDGNCAGCTLCAENVLPHVLLETVSWKPERLLATIEQGYISAFKIWEEYKEYCSYIQIKTLRRDKEPQILEWQKKEENNIELSVIFPVYNVAAYLEKCIATVTSWTAPYVEFLFVNDGSPDNSREIILEWAKKDYRVKLLDKENGGCASARQFGLEHAKGNYIGFIDPDDFVDESMFRKLLRAAMNGSYDISYCGYNEYYENTKKTKRVEDALGWPYCDGTADEQKIRELMIYSPVAIWRRIYKAELLKKNGIHFYIDLKRFDDLPFKIETFASARSIIAVPEYLYYYRLSRPGQDVSADDERLYVHFDIFEYLDSSIANTFDARLTDYLQICKVQTHIYALQKIRTEYKKIYLKRAKDDLGKNGTTDHTYRLVKRKLGEENAELYKQIIKENTAAFCEKKSNR